MMAITTSNSISVNAQPRIVAARIVRFIIRLRRLQVPADEACSVGGPRHRESGEPIAKVGSRRENAQNAQEDALFLCQETPSIAQASNARANNQAAYLHTMAPALGSRRYLPDQAGRQYHPTAGVCGGSWLQDGVRRSNHVIPNAG